MTGRDAPVRVALDLMGGDAAPGAVVDAALLVRQEQPGVELTLVGPPDVAADAPFPRVAASQVVEATEDPARAVRAKRDATLRVAARLVRDGAVDATVSAGPTGAVLAAALFTLGRLPGMTRPAVAVTVPAPTGPVLLLDAGGSVDVEAGLLAQFALAGAAYAATALGVPDPRVGLLSNGTEPGKGDALRKAAYPLLADLPVRFVGNVEAGDALLGGAADVVVTDGFTGNVLLKGVEGAVRALAAAGSTAAGGLHPERLGGAVLLGVDGVSVVAHGGSTPRALASAVATAVRAVREGAVPRAAAALADLVARRRAAAGLAP